MGFLFFLGIVGFAIYMWTKNSKASQAQWQTAAEQLNLAYYAGGFGGGGRISGTKKGHRVNISTFTKSSGNSSQTYTKYQIEYRQRIPIDMKMTNQGALHRLGKAFGLQDIEVGNPAFDDRVLVKGMDPGAVRKFLTPEVRDAVKLLVINYSDVTITNEHICVNKRGREGDSAAIIATTKRLISFCDKMNASSRGGTPLKNEKTVVVHPSAEPILEVKEPPEIPAIEPSLDPYTTPRPIVPEPPAIPVEPEPEAMGRGIEPAEVVVEIDDSAQADPASDPATAPEPPEPEVVEEPPPPAIDLSIPADIQDLAHELFGGSTGSSLTAGKIFDEQYKGRKITGSGIVKRVSKFNYDPIFTNSKGVKVTLAVCEIAGAYSKIKVTAEVVYPVEQLGALKARMGTSLPIAGKLIAQNSMMNQLFIAEG